MDAAAHSIQALEGPRYEDQFDGMGYRAAAGLDCRAAAAAIGSLCRIEGDHLALQEYCNLMQIYITCIYL